MDHAALAAVAAGQAGAFTSAQAKAAGWTERQIRAARRAGTWRRLYEGAHVDAALWAAMDERARSLCQVHGRLLVVGDGWHAARGSAVLVHGLPFLGKPPAQPQLVRARSRGSGRAVSAHERVAALPPRDRCEVDGCRVTSLCRTAVDVARTSSLVAGLVVADAVLHRGAPREELEAVAAEHDGYPGAPSVRRVVAAANGLAESPFESLSRGRMLELDLPAPELQVEVWLSGRFVARVDFLWRQHNLFGEADGRSKYTSLDAFYAEKLREQALEDLGFEVVRWDWETAWAREQQLAATIRRGLARGRLNTLAPGVRLVPPASQRSAA